MKRVSISFAVILTASLVAAMLVETSCEQSSPACQVGRGDFAALYNLKDGDENDSICHSLIGDVLGMHTYYNETSNGWPDYENAIFAIKPENIGVAISLGEDFDLTDENEDHKPWSVGDFDRSYPDSNDLCTVSDLNPAELTLDDHIQPDTDSETDTDGDDDDDDTIVVPAYTMSYEWSNVSVLVSTAYTGTQVKADLTYSFKGGVRDEDTNEIEEIECEAEYEVWAVMPAHDCTKRNMSGAALDEDGNPTSESGKPPVGDEERCKPEANPDEGISTGSGISPDFPVECHPILLLCVLTEEPPSIN